MCKNACKTFALLGDFFFFYVTQRADMILRRVVLNGVG